MAAGLTGLARRVLKAKREKAFPRRSPTAPACAFDNRVHYAQHRRIEAMAFSKRQAGPAFKFDYFLQRMGKRNLFLACVFNRLRGTFFAFR